MHALPRHASLIPRCLLLIAGLVPATRAEEPPEPLILLPVRLHVLTSETLDEVNCALTDADLERILGKVNRVWGQAGIHFALESIVREEAASQGRFQLARSLDPEAELPLELLRVLRPEASRDLDGLHVYFVHELTVNGVFLGRDDAFVKETASLREVPGGIDEPIPRVMSHELGHALGLSHVRDRSHLMASGTTGTKLGDEEVAAARARAAERSGYRTRETLSKEAELARRDGPPERAALLDRWLDALDRPR